MLGPVVGFEGEATVQAFSLHLASLYLSLSLFLFLPHLHFKTPFTRMQVSAGANGFNHVVNLGTYCSDPQLVQGAQVRTFDASVVVYFDESAEWSLHVLCVCIEVCAFAFTSFVSISAYVPVYYMLVSCSLCLHADSSCGDSVKPAGSPHGRWMT